MAVKITTPYKKATATTVVGESVVPVTETDFVSQVTTMVDKTTAQVDSYIAPVRESILKRFPVLFSLLTTFGVATTFYGFEKFVDGIPLLAHNPLLMLILGMGILAVTGTLYKKLS
jgi:midasin (ATPase involved in ribosome maturation)